VDFVYGRDLEPEALCGGAQEYVQRVYGITAGRRIDTHGKAAPRAILAASNSMM
jgi:hypothetical protein